MRKAREISLDPVYIYIARRVRKTMPVHNVTWSGDWSRRTSTGLRMRGQRPLAFWRAILVGSTRTPRPARRRSCCGTICLQSGSDDAIHILVYDLRVRACRT